MSDLLLNSVRRAQGRLIASQVMTKVSNQRLTLKRGQAPAAFDLDNTLHNVGKNVGNRISSTVGNLVQSITPQPTSTAQTGVSTHPAPESAKPATSKPPEPAVPAAEGVGPDTPEAPPAAPVPGAETRPTTVTPPVVEQQELPETQQQQPQPQTAWDNQAASEQYAQYLVESHGMTPEEAQQYVQSEDGQAGVMLTGVDQLVSQGVTPEAGPEATASALGTIFRLKTSPGVAEDPEMQQHLTQQIQRIRAKMQDAAQGWTPEQWQSFRGQVATAAMPPEMLKVIQESGGDPQAHVQQNMVPLIEKHLRGAVDEQVAQVAQAVTETEDTGFFDWAKNNWQLLAIPAGLIGLLSGNKIGMVLGTLGLAYGGYNLYDRYQNLTQDPQALRQQGKEDQAFEAEAVQGAVAQAAQQQGPDGQYRPFTDPQQAFQEYVIAQMQEAQDRGAGPDELQALRQRLLQLEPQAVRGIQDTKLLAGLGFTNQMAQRIKQQSDQVMQDLWGPQQPAGGVTDGR